MTSLYKEWKTIAQDRNILIENIHKLYMDTAFEKGMSEDLYDFLEKLRDVLDTER